MPAPIPFVLPVTREEIQVAESWKGKGVCVKWCVVEEGESEARASKQR
jgi:hypothetical protein